MRTCELLSQTFRWRSTTSFEDAQLENLKQLPNRKEQDPSEILITTLPLLFFDKLRNANEIFFMNILFSDASIFLYEIFKNSFRLFPLTK